MDLNIRITLELSDELNQQIERLIDALVTAQTKWEDDDEEDMGNGSDTSE